MKESCSGPQPDGVGCAKGLLDVGEGMMSGFFRKDLNLFLQCDNESLESVECEFTD